MLVCAHCFTVNNAVCVRHNQRMIDPDIQRHPDYTLGYRHGSDSEMPDTRGVSNREAYFDGYAAGSQKRDERFADGTIPSPVPEWLTPAQVEAVKNLYRRSPDGSPDRWEFFSRVQEGGFGSDRFAVVHWCSMYVGIEPDGYTHT